MATADSSAAAGGAGEVFSAFLKLGCTSFGGPIAHIGYFRREFVERRNWLSEEQFAQLLAICQFLPGPASSQLGFALGLSRAGWVGAFAAFIAFTVPSALLLVAFASSLSLFAGDTGQAAIHGLKLVAIAVVAHAVLGMARQLCPDWPRRAIAVAALAMLLFAATAWMQLVAVAFGAVAGLLLCRGLPAPSGLQFDLAVGRRTAVVLLCVFAVLLIGLPLLTQQGESFAVAEAFYRAGALVFGGGHVVLPLLEESVVGAGWVGVDDFLAGYGAAQAVPGPLFTFSAYLGAVMPSGQPLLMAVVALLFMFLPGLLLVAAALPLWQSVAMRPGAASIVAGVNAAVVGILAAALYDPVITSGAASITDAFIAAVGFAMLASLRLSPLWVVAWCVGASLATTLL